MPRGYHFPKTRMITKMIKLLKRKFLYRIFRYKSTVMTNVKISAKGQAFLSKGNFAMALAKRLAIKASNLSSKHGVVVEIGNQAVFARSVAQKTIQIK